MKIALSFTNILMSVLNGKLDLGDVEFAWVGCDPLYASGQMGIPMEATWGNKVKPHLYELHAPEPTEADVDPEAWANWVRVRDHLKYLFDQGKLKRYKVGPWAMAFALSEEGHQIFMDKRWLSLDEAAAYWSGVSVCTRCGDHVGAEGCTHVPW